MKPNALNALRFAPAVLLIPALVAADTIRMKNGNSMDGIVLKETPTEVTINVGVGSITLKRSQIASIQKSDAEGESQIRDKWQQHYFSHEKYTPEGLEGLASEFRALETQRNAAWEELKSLRSPTGRSKALRNELARLEQQAVDCMRSLPSSMPPADGKHRAEVEAYNALVTRHNALNARITIVRDELMKSQANDDKHRRSISTYLQVLLKFRTKFEARHDQFRQAGGTKQEDVFFSEMARKIETYSAEIRETDVPFEAVDRHAIITVRINDRVDARLLLDTGATVVQISQSLADRLNMNLTRNPMVKVTLADGRESEVKAVMLDSVQVADARAEQVPGIVSPNELSNGVDGLLGMSFLQRFEVHLDGASNKLILKRFDP